MSKFGIPPPSNAIITLEDDDYVDLGFKIAKQIDTLRVHNGWTLTTNGDERSTIYSRKNGLPEANESMLLLTTELSAPMWVVEKLIAPWDEYRCLWDDLLDEVSILAKLPEETYVIYHATKKRITLSVRESVDLIHVHRAPNRVIFASCGTSYGGVPLTRNKIRTHQYVGGYVLDVVDETKTRLTMIFHADLNLKGPKIMTALAERYKPKLMLDNVRALRGGIKKYKDEIMEKYKKV